ncbi:unnamed protein product, partial [Pylaiella littoralis]
MQTMDTPPSTPPHRPKGGELSVGRRYAIVVEAALAIPPGQVRIPKGALGPIGERYGVSPQYPSRLLKSAKDQINANQEVNLSSKGRKGRPSLLTPSKVAALKKVNSQNRSFTLRQVSNQLTDLGLEFGKDTVRRWFKELGAAKKARRIKPSLSDAQKRRRIDYICDQVDETTGEYLDQYNAVHLDESWFYLMKEKAKVRVFLDEEISGAPRVQHKSHLPKIMIIVANARPDPAHDFDGKIGIWRICVIETAQRSSKRRKRGEEYEFDVTIDAEWYKDWYIDEFLPAIKKKMPWQRSKRVVVQQDGASPHTGKGNPEILNSAGMGRGWLVELVMQPAQSPDININHVRFFASLKSRVWAMNACSVDELAESIYQQYEDYDGETLERVWQSLSKVYNQTLRNVGDNDFAVEHTGVRKRQREGTSEKVVKHDKEAFERA